MQIHSLDLVSQSQPERPDGKVRLPLVSAYLEEQQRLSAVEHFSKRHDAGVSELASRYEALMPASPPGPGEQYAFRVDLDRCTGCKACVTACHSLNGLDDEETWRSVGQLVGADTEPFLQTVTTACHHCLEPACLHGCPVLAYEKDPTTGIVRHLDDQCIGCRYCTLTCPYGAPQYNARLGIVRKCDLCSERLGAGEAPACVQACPNEAISIALVEETAARERAEADAFVPGARSPGLTVPATEYVSRRAAPQNALPADFYRVRPGAPHPPLAVMLVLTQLSVGAFAVDFLLRFLLPPLFAAHAFHAVVALLVGFVALGASVLHLGRPRFAYRAVLGLKTSWLSREIVAFGAFAGLATLYAAASVVPAHFWSALIGAPERVDAVRGALGGAVNCAGIAGILCSVLVYRATGRPFWSGPATGIKFFLTSAILGVSLTLASLVIGFFGPAPVPIARALIFTVSGLTLVKLAFEASLFFHLGAARHHELKRSALLLCSELLPWTRARFLAGAVGGVLLPGLLLAELDYAGASNAARVLALGVVLALAFGELVERSLFFSAEASPHMPGGSGS